jgi:putative phage-type endonuclease
MSEFKQHTLGWYRDRLGKWTGSMVGKLMMVKKNGEFYDTALSYIYQVAATRSMNEKIVEDDDLFQAYLDSVDITTKAMRYGTEQEPNARELYCKIKKVKVIERGSVEHPNIPFFASSPDGFIKKDKQNKVGCIEIKCPNQNTFIKYKTEIKDNETFKKCNPDYYYQCQSHIMCTGADYCDFVVYCPWQSVPIFIYRVLPDIEAQQSIKENIEKAEKIVERITHI